MSASPTPLPKGQGLCNADWNVVEPDCFGTIRVHSSPAATSRPPIASVPAGGHRRRGRGMTM